MPTGPTYALAQDPARTLADMAWVAGIIEGEGHIAFPKRGVSQVHVYVKMTDEDVVRRLRDVTGLGNVTGPNVSNYPNSKPFWVWCVSEGRQVADLLWRTHDFFGARRGARAAEAMERLSKIRIPRTNPNYRIPHGTYAGYRAEQKLGLDPCAECLTAKRTYSREYQRKRAQMKRGVAV